MALSYLAVEPARVVDLAKETGGCVLSCELSLCLSRACLGKMTVVLISKVVGPNDTMSDLTDAAASGVGLDLCDEVDVRPILRKDTTTRRLTNK